VKETKTHKVENKDDDDDNNINNNNIENVGVAIHPISYPMSTGSNFHGGKEAGA
jgi:hypothetical protein